jgi:hypothetical protein
VGKGKCKMKKYQVKVFEVHSCIIDVEAEDEQAAINVAEEMLCMGDEVVTKYEYTLDIDDWKVWEA